ncbi:hypothetical protein RvY_11413 [Ramazzottius varieornatus]|uniref:Uncharacterized protein n=1 Tax=Ramazzottius varieornatus TaxID=947166 RepID=A0A1D1VG06_RAMVA|nr:hypothetical protein RvY_11413 [Ramazzottius varieornatus]
MNPQDREELPPQVEDQATDHNGARATPPHKVPLIDGTTGADQNNPDTLKSPLSDKLVDQYEFAMSHKTQSPVERSRNEHEIAYPAESNTALTVLREEVVLSSSDDDACLSSEFSIVSLNTASANVGELATNTASSDLQMYVVPPPWLFLMKRQNATMPYCPQNSNYPSSAL